jgi:hypothetical protein
MSAETSNNSFTQPNSPSFRPRARPRGTAKIAEPQKATGICEQAQFAIPLHCNSSVDGSVHCRPLDGGRISLAFARLGFD